ncbi:MAG TPA: nuclear transport factor 2 family protein [Chitinophagaceae bacterium]|nr:nuclear transport factor 2 family protein [Chitinophagaceae bacterium]
MEDIKSILLSLKEKALEATKNADAEFYEDYLADNAVAIVPIGVFDKKRIVEQMGSKNSPFKSSKIEDTKAIVLTPESGIVTYKATYQKPDKSEYQVFVTTVYSKINNTWKGVFYQQTPVIAAN